MRLLILLAWIGSVVHSHAQSPVTQAEKAFTTLCDSTYVEAIDTLSFKVSEDSMQTFSVRNLYYENGEVVKVIIRISNINAINTYVLAQQVKPTLNEMDYRFFSEKTATPSYWEAVYKRMKNIVQNTMKWKQQ